ncbi:serine/threonine protein kinase [Rudaea cellulosilytica]|uniref:serine/threonine protein kinase n=1 Tax=Rudaea cellulosilytica TaxID=540746 RepID=UPI0003727C23|nr:serine/threonine-protein kinase [Rudaea cellulosilytica]
MSTGDPERWRRLSALFEGAIDLPREARERYIVEKCANDSELETELRRMLAADEQAELSEFLTTSLAAAQICDSAAGEDGYAPGTRRFGPYRLLRLIGRGGMGEVHLAERGDGQFEQRVALKLLPQPTPGLLQRFRQERQILARLEHPNIARLLDGGVGEANIPYFAMEFVDGTPITEFVAANDLDVTATLMLFLRVCDAVQYAHRNLVVHRDLKPSNVLVARDGMPKLLDFGIAKLLDTTAEGEATRTQLRAFTPDYAAPEQIRGEAVTTATDVYALGVVLYELLAGARPYKLKRNESLEQAILVVEPPEPSTAAASTTRAKTLRGDLDRIVLTALAKEPERRYASAEALAADIRNYLGGLPITARGDGAMYKLRKFILRNKAIAAATAAVALILVAATAISTGQALRAERERNSAVRTRDFVLGMLANVGPYRRSVAPPPTLARMVEASAPRVLTEFAGDVPTQIPLLRAFAGVYLSLGRAGDSATYLEYALERERAASSAPQLIEETQLALANNYYYLRRFDDSNRVTDAVLADLVEAPADEAHKRLEFSAREIRLLAAWSRGHIDEAEKNAVALLADMRRTLGADHVETASAEGYHAYMLIDRGELLRAGALIEHQSRVDLAAFPAGYPGNYGDAATIAWWLIQYGDAQAAEPLAARVLTLRNGVYSGVGFAPAYTHFLRGWARCKLGRHAEGLVDFDDAQSVLADSGKVGYMYQSRILLHQARCLLDAGEPEQARVLYTRARDFAINDGGADTPNARAASAALAYVDWRNGNSMAISLLQQMLRSQQAARDPLAEQTRVWLMESGADQVPITATADPAERTELAATRTRLLALAEQLTQAPETK